jgi:hypothetical protein
MGLALLNRAICDSRFLFRADFLMLGKSLVTTTLLAAQRVVGARPFAGGVLHRVLHVIGVPSFADARLEYIAFPGSHFISVLSASKAGLVGAVLLALV